jgi:hypothetical protein
MTSRSIRPVRIINVGEGRFRAQLSVVEETLLVRRHVLAPVLGHHQVVKEGIV